MALDPKVKPLLERLSKVVAPREDPSEFRRVRNQLFVSLYPRREAGNVEDTSFQGRNGEVKMRIYKGGRGIALYFHGGGFVYGNLDTHDNICRLISSLSGVTLVAVDYRLAPEHKFPAPVIDAEDALDWVISSEAKLDNSKIGLIGDSAGGNLAAVLSQERRDKVKFQALIYPVTDFKDDSGSMREFASGYFLTADTMKWYNAQYLREGDEEDPRASPIRGKLNGLPRALVVTAEYDPLRDQGEKYAQALKEAGNEAVSVRYGGMIHGFVSFYPFLDPGMEAIVHVAGSLRRWLGE
jgi:acetyl esterase